MVPKAINDMEMTLDDYNRMLGAGDATDVRAEVSNQTYNAMHNRAVFFLHKGPRLRDSRGHVGLAHRLTVDRTEITIDSGAPLELTFRIENTGEAAWLHENDEIFGIVRLGTHLYRGDGTLVSIDFTRHGLPVRVLPGDVVEMAVVIRLLGDGAFRLVFDLVAEGVTWFENAGSTPVYVDVTIGAR